MIRDVREFRGARGVQALMSMSLSAQLVTGEVRLPTIFLDHIELVSVVKADLPKKVLEVLWRKKRLVGNGAHYFSQPCITRNWGTFTLGGTHHVSSNGRRIYRAYAGNPLTPDEEKARRGSFSIGNHLTPQEKLDVVSLANNEGIDPWTWQLKRFNEVVYRHREGQLAIIRSLFRQHALPIQMTPLPISCSKFELYFEIPALADFKCQMGRIETVVTRVFNNEIAQITDLKERRREHYHAGWRVRVIQEEGRRTEALVKVYPKGEDIRIELSLSNPWLPGRASNNVDALNAELSRIGQTLAAALKTIATELIREEPVIDPVKLRQAVRFYLSKITDTTLEYVVEKLFQPPRVLVKGKEAESYGVSQYQIDLLSVPSRRRKPYQGILAKIPRKSLMITAAGTDGLVQAQRGGVYVLREDWLRRFTEDAGQVGPSLIPSAVMDLLGPVILDMSIGMVWCPEVPALLPVLRRKAAGAPPGASAATEPNN